MGLFTKKQESQYQLPAKLEMLLKMAVEDGEISEKKLSVLRAEAAKHDISNDELDMIIESRLPKKKKSEEKDLSKPMVSSEELTAVISDNLYCASDTVTQTFQKYEILCDYSGKKMESADQDKLHRARLTFISSIVSPSDKETMLELIAHCLPYTKKRLADKALQAVASIGAGALKTVSFSAKVVKVASFGKLSVANVAANAVDNLGELTEQAVVTNYEELAKAWRSKADSLFADAKELAGGMFNGDRPFKTKLSELSEQYKQYK
ncbi:MAG: hypothetical protein J6T32_01395 [Paludibacteraceae bacterium]|nr:hypothetical protein [Paludibacteraceae bacterium]